jgi:hypothetical protein
MPIASMPEISYTKSVEDPGVSGLLGLADKTQQVGDDGRRLAGVVSSGLSAMGQELVKTQMSRAAADVVSGLNEKEEQIKSKQYRTLAEVKELFGEDYEKLDPAIREEFELRQEAINAGAKDRPDIPTALVAGALYSAKSERLLDQSAGGVVGSWRTGFKDSLRQHLIGRQAQFNEQMTGQLKEYFATQQVDSIEKLANAGDFFAARQTVAASQALKPAMKAELNAKIDKMEAAKPIYDAMLSKSYGTMAKLIQQLNDPEQFKALDQAERSAFSNRLEAEVNQFKVEARRAKEEAIKARDDKGWRGIFEAERAQIPLSMDMIPKTGSISVEAEHAMIQYVQRKANGQSINTQWHVYQNVIDMAAKDPDKFKQLDLNGLYRLRLADSEFKQVMDLQYRLRTTGSQDPEYDNFFTTDEEINTLLRGYGGDFNPDAKSEATRARVGEVKKAVQVALMQAQQGAGGKKPDPIARGKIINQAIGDVIGIQKKGFFGGMKPGGYEKLRDMTDDNGKPIGVPMYAMPSLIEIAKLDGKAQDVEHIASIWKGYLKEQDFIDNAAAAELGRFITEDQAIRVWRYTEANRERLKSILGLTGGITNDPATLQIRLYQRALREMAGVL